MNQHIKQLFLKAIKLGIAVNVLVYLVACLTPFISPAHFYPFTFLALAFPLLLLSMILWFVIFLFIKRKISYLFFFFLLLGYKNISSTVGFNFFENNTKPKQAKSFRVLSWNVKNFITHEKRYDTANGPLRKIMKFIDSSKADILCVQDFEQLDSSIFFQNVSYIKNTLQFPYTYFSVDIDTTTFWGHGVYGTCIFSKFPINKAGSISYNGNHFKESLGYADIVINNKSIRVFNTHLRSMYIGLDTNAKRLDFKYVIDDTNIVFHSSKFDKLRHFDTSHINQVHLIKKVMDTTKTAFVFCADMNSVPSSYAYHYLAKNLKDAFVQRGFGWGGTYDSRLPFLRIDVILMSKELKASNYYSPKLKLSDHFPVVTDIYF